MECSRSAHTVTSRYDPRVGVLYVPVLYGEQRVLDTLEHRLCLLHCGDRDVFIQEADPADRAYYHRRAGAKHFQQLKTSIQL